MKFGVLNTCTFYVALLMKKIRVYLYVIFTYNLGSQQCP